jgi:hypothetical protein
VAGLAIHYGFGAFIGAAYGFGIEKTPQIGTRSQDAVRGVSLAPSRRIGIAVTGLSDRPNKYALRDHLNALEAHFLSESTTETVKTNW